MLAWYFSGVQFVETEAHSNGVITQAFPPAKGIIAGFGVLLAVRFFAFVQIFRGPF